ncbi:MAG: rhomboid family intramembrane serine protease [Bacteroidota bacterium]
MQLSHEIKNSFKEGDILAKLIYINLGVFILVNLAYVVLFLMNSKDIGEAFVHEWIAVPSDISKLIVKPWTLITYMFLHEGFLHILFNLIWIWVFGKIFLEYWDEKKLLGVYLLGGIVGAFFYIAAFNIFPVFEKVVAGSFALGASASAMSIAVAIAVFKPSYRLYLVFLGPVQLKYIALFFVGLDVLTLARGNPGGHIAHLGGAFFGYVFANQYIKKRKDLTSPIIFLLNSIASLFQPKAKMHVHYKKSTKKMTDMEYNKSKAEEQKNMDKILDKIAKHGYDSLTKQEKEQLFRMRNS